MSVLKYERDPLCRKRVLGFFFASLTLLISPAMKSAAGIKESSRCDHPGIEISSKALPAELRDMSR
jgi:hypothetical protein